MPMVFDDNWGPMGFYWSLSFGMLLFLTLYVLFMIFAALKPKPSGFSSDLASAAVAPGFDLRFASSPDQGAPGSLVSYSVAPPMDYKSGFTSGLAGNSAEPPVFYNIGDIAETRAAEEKLIREYQGLAPSIRGLAPSIRGFGGKKGLTEGLAMASNPNRWQSGFAGSGFSDKELLAVNRGIIN